MLPDINKPNWTQLVLFLSPWLEHLLWIANSMILLRKKPLFCPISLDLTVASSHFSTKKTVDSKDQLEQNRFAWEEESFNWSTTCCNWSYSAVSTHSVHPASAAATAAATAATTAVAASIQSKTTDDCRLLLISQPFEVNGGLWCWECWRFSSLSSLVLFNQNCFEDEWFEKYLWTL